MTHYAIIEDDAGQWILTRCEIVHTPELGVRKHYTIRDPRGYLHKVLFVMAEDSDGFMKSFDRRDC